MQFFLDSTISFLYSLVGFLLTSGRDDTLRLALQVNGVQLKLLRLRKQMETKYAELIISNSEQNKLQQEVGVSRCTPRQQNHSL